MLTVVPFTFSLEILQNQSFVTEFVLLGLSQNPTMQKIIFVVFLFIYIATVGGNLLIVVTISSSPALWGFPMYFFLVFLSFLDACFSSIIVPKMIVDALLWRKTISFVGCMTQLVAEPSCAGVEVTVLSAMAYDRYVAISKPLHYSSIMNRRLCALLMAVAWTGGFLACTDTHIFVGFSTILFFSLLLVSYGVILLSLRTRSSEGQQKALSTCGSHIAVVTLFFIPSIFDTILTPLFNPLIYTFRNKEVKSAMRKVWDRIMVLSNEK
uniref:G-protein coupled receptors family 1 profile domain-containing protein n=1 Tax=Capra hircus TaxID=9925 RepID=A0A452EGY7_CAPHI